MTKKYMIAAAVLLVCLAGVTAAFAVNFAVRGNAQDIVPDGTVSAPGTVFIRYYRTGFPTAAPAPSTCATTFHDLGGNQRFCEGNYLSNKGGAQGPVENLDNFGGAVSGTRFFGTYGMQTGGGTASHVGYYAWNSNIVNDTDTSRWFDPACGGTKDAIGCAGHAEPGDALGSDQANVPGGPITPIGSMRPIPVPRVSSVSPTTSPGTINLGWNAAVESGGSGQAASYILWWATDSAADGTCSLPTDAQLTNQLNTVPIAGIAAAVDVAADLGQVVGSEVCVTFALQIEYANLGGNSSTAVRSRWKSANSQPVYLGSGGLAADIVNLRARAIGASRDGLRVQVSWSTALEDGVQGFFVARSNTADGEFVRVSDIIPASGQPSTYDFLDVVERTRGAHNNTGLFYRIETLDIDDSVSLAGPVSVSLSETGTSTRPKRRR